MVFTTELKRRKPQHGKINQIDSMRSTDKEIVESDFYILCIYTCICYSGVLQYILICCKRETFGSQKHSTVG